MLSPSMKALIHNPLLSTEGGLNFDTPNPNLTPLLNLYSRDAPAFPTYPNPLNPNHKSLHAATTQQAQQMYQSNTNLTGEAQIQDLMALHRSKDMYQASSGLLIKAIDTVTDTIASQQRLILGVNLLLNSDFKKQFQSMRDSLSVPTVSLSTGGRQPYEFSSVLISETMTLDCSSMAYIEAFESSLGASSITTTHLDQIKSHLKLKDREKQLRLNQIRDRERAMTERKMGKKMDKGEWEDDDDKVGAAVKKYLKKMSFVNPQDIILKVDVSDYYLERANLPVVKAKAQKECYESSSNKHQVAVGTSHSTPNSFLSADVARFLPSSPKSKWLYSRLTGWCLARGRPNLE